jgi:H+/Cl- antiporter ClcA
MAVRKGLLIIQSALCGIIAMMLIAGALRIYSEGLTRRQSDPSADIYTTEAISEAAAPILPVALILVVSTVTCLILGAADEDKGSGIETVPDLSSRAKEPERQRLIRFTVILVAIILIIIGIFNGSLSDVFIKASRICTECIGLG